MGLFAALNATVALGTITAAAVWTRLPLLFPPLAPSAFILFSTPLAYPAAPRNVILSHTLAVLVGRGVLSLAAAVLPTAGLENPDVMNWERAMVLVVVTLVTTGLMLGLRCSHPPAAATGLIAGMGYFGEPLQVLGLICASVVLAAQAFVLNRVFGGLPYPLWRYDHRVARDYGVLAGLGGSKRGYWQQFSRRVLATKDPDSQPD